MTLAVASAVVPPVVDLFGAEATWLLRRRGGLDVGAMRAAAAHLVGTHDFTSFRGAGCQARSPVKTIASIDVVSAGRADSTPISGLLDERASVRHGHLDTGAVPDTVDPGGGGGPISAEERLAALFSWQRLGYHPLRIVVRGPAFLYHQVRNVTGCLVAVGAGALSPLAIPGLLAARNRSLLPATAPAHGLCLAGVDYPLAVE
jgi:tRNA pseudouridine38-40 synthase